MISVIVYWLQLKLVLSPFENTFLISAVLTSWPKLNFGFLICLLSLRLIYTTFPFDFLLACLGVNFVELWIVLLYLLTTADSSLNQSALPARQTVFF